MNKTLLKEYKELDSRITGFRKHWNTKARNDLKFALEHHYSKGKQDPLPDWFAPAIARWQELKMILRIN